MTVRVSRDFSNRILLINNRMNAVNEISRKYGCSQAVALVILKRLEMGIQGYITVGF